MTDRAPRVKSLLISSTYFLPNLGGIGQAVASIASALGPDHACCLTGVAEDGSNPFYRTSNEFAKRRSAAGYDSDSHWKMPPIYRRPRAFRPGALRLPTMAAAVGEIMLRERPNIVQIAIAGDGYLGLLLRRWLGLPFVVYAHGNEVLETLDSQYKTPLLALRSADRVLANSTFTASLLQEAGVSPDRIAVTLLGCDVGRFEPAPVNTQLGRRLLGARFGTPVILTVGGLVERKGHDMVIRSMPHILERVPNATYVIAGEGVQREYLERIASTLGVRQHIVFAGQIDDDELRDLYGLCDVFAMISRERLNRRDVEGFGLVYLEANCTGKPVVGGRAGGAVDAIADGVSGLLTNPTDEREIGDVLSRLLLDKELAARLGSQGRARVLEQFTWDRIGGRVLGVLQDTLREKRA